MEETTLAEVMDTTPPPLELEAEDIEGFAEELEKYHAIFSPLFTRSEQGKWADLYLKGLMSTVQRKSIEPMALNQPEGNVRAMQQFIGVGGWDDERILKEHRCQVQDSLGEEDGIVIVDGSDFPKQGKHSVGVARQYCGATGKIDNCQAGIFMGYASRKGYTLLDRRLYMPEKWFTPEYEERRRKCKVPEDVEFITGPQIAGEMIKKVVKEGTITAKWVTFDEHFGNNPDLLDKVDGLKLLYMAEVPFSTGVWVQRPKTYIPEGKGGGRPRTKVCLCSGEDKPQRVDTLPIDSWQSMYIKEGAKGPQKADFAFVRAIAVRDKLPGPEVWVIFKRSLEGEIKIFLSNAPADIPLQELARISGMRWPIESCFKESKGELGMGHYETRSFKGWYHHMTMVILAHHFLVKMKLALKKSPSLNCLPSARLAASHIALQRV